jgi:hypothetical protein
MAKQRETRRTQISVGVDDELREQLEAAARRELRSLSGEFITACSDRCRPRTPHKGSARHEGRAEGFLWNGDSNHSLT